MDDLLLAATKDFECIAISTGFRFNRYGGSVEWEKLDEFVVDDIIKNVDVKSLSSLVASVLNYNVEKMSPSKKIFRLSQLIIDFLLHCKNHLMLKTKIESMIVCELCEKTFTNLKSLKYHCLRWHSLNTDSDSSQDKLVESLKLKIIQLQTQLKEMNTNLLNKFQGFETSLKEQQHNNCYSVHKNKLLYHLIPQPGDNPMQTQEMYWKQKYDTLEENYNILKNDFEKNQNTSKSIILHHKYQQCDYYEIEKFSKSIQTESTVENSCSVSTPKIRHQNSNLLKNNGNIDNCNMDVVDNQISLKDSQLNNDESPDKDFYELKKLRLEARMNCIENNIYEEHLESLLSTDNTDSIKISLILGRTRVNELFKNVPLLDLIKFDVKELVNKRLEECYRFTDESFVEDNFVHETSLNDSKKMYEISTIEENKLEQHNTSNVECDKSPIKKNDTIISKFKKKALYLSKVFSQGSKNNKKESSTYQDQEISHSKDVFNLLSEKNEENEVIIL